MCPSNRCYIFGQCGMYTTFVWKYKDRLGMHMNVEPVLTFPDKEVYTHKNKTMMWCTILSCNTSVVWVCVSTPKQCLHFRTEWHTHTKNKTKNAACAYALRDTACKAAPTAEKKKL